jgi:hypothetical protein
MKSKNQPLLRLIEGTATQPPLRHPALRAVRATPALAPFAGVLEVVAAHAVEHGPRAATLRRLLGQGLALLQILQRLAMPRLLCFEAPPRGFDIGGGRHMLGSC